MNGPVLNQDFMDFFHALQESKTQWIVVGAHAMAVHGVPRTTGDIDIFIRPTAENAACAMAALVEFGAPVETHGITTEDLATPGVVYQMGLPPRRIDILTAISGLSFDEAWTSRTCIVLHGIEVAFLGLEALIRNKTASGRDKDLIDVRNLEKRHIEPR